MLKERVENILNEQVKKEAEASQVYLAMASWAEQEGFDGISEFLYAHSEEEREHMLKLFHYINEREGKAIVPALEQPEKEFGSVKQMFEAILDHEKMVTEAINEIVTVSRDERDYATENFIQWYVAEQVEEESLFQGILDKLEMIGDDKGKLYIFDKDLKGSRGEE